MYKILRPDRDAYVTSRVVKGFRVHSGNVGAAGSLDLFKLYGYTYETTSSLVPNIELSRLLIHYDLQPLRSLISAGKIDPGHSSFNCTLKLFDVYGGQPTPTNFTVSVYPLSRSFDEGLGKDVVYYSDQDVCNFLSGSRAQGAWLLSGCGLGGGIPGSVDYITASTDVAGGASLLSEQTFESEEDLEVDVTLAVSATIAGLLPDCGFRIALVESLENDQHSYFVKRFASRTAYNESKRPRLIVKYDDSVQDDTQSLFFDSNSCLFMYNYTNFVPANLTSGSSLSQVTGSNCLMLKLSTEISGGWYTLSFSGSQHANGIFGVTGVYSASVYLPSSDTVLASKLAQSGSVKFTPVWESLDGTVGYLTGAVITARPPQRMSSIPDVPHLIVSTHGLRESYYVDEEVVVKVHIFDSSSPLIIASRLPAELPSKVIRNVHYQVRDAVSGVVEIPFDTSTNSTRVSSDATGMFFKLDMSSLTPNRSYAIEYLVTVGNSSQVHKSASTIFRVSSLR